MSRSDDLPSLSLSDVEACITHQLVTHGLTSEARDRAHAAARNVAAVLWLHYQDALSGRARARAALARSHLELVRLQRAGKP